MDWWSAITGNAGQIDATEARTAVARVLVDGEDVLLGFRAGRDCIVFTNWRIVAVDHQGFTGKKVEYLSLPYRTISRFSIETAGMNDWDAEMKVYQSGGATPAMSKRFNRKVDVYAVSRTLSAAMADI